MRAGVGMGPKREHCLLLALSSSVYSLCREILAELKGKRGLSPWRWSRESRRSSWISGTAAQACVSPPAALLPSCKIYRTHPKHCFYSLCACSGWGLMPSVPMEPACWKVVVAEEGWGSRGCGDVAQPKVRVRWGEAAKSKEPLSPGGGHRAVGHVQERCGCWALA